MKQKDKTETNFTDGDTWLTPDEVDRLEVSYLAGKKVGTKEVVEWLLERSTAQEVEFPPKLIAFSMLYEYWQAKLKEWGIE